MTSRVNIYLRVRPVLQTEINSDGYTQCIATKNNIAYVTKDDAAIVIDQNTNFSENDKISCFNFDHIFDINSEQAEIFEKIGLPSVDHLVNGFNVTLFAYGQTGTGKTYTMDGGNDKNSRGLASRLIENLFERTERLSNFGEVYLAISVIQIYNEEVYDLLDENTSKAKLRLNKDGSPIIEDLTECDILDFKMAQGLIDKAKKRRVTSATVMNQESSRSHMIICIKMIQELKTTYGSSFDTKKIKYSKINIVDLAGSEAAGKIHAHSSEDFKTGVNINKS